MLKLRFEILIFSILLFFCILFGSLYVNERRDMDTATGLIINYALEFDKRGIPDLMVYSVDNTRVVCTSGLEWAKNKWRR